MTIYAEKAGTFTGLPEPEQLGHDPAVKVEFEQIPDHQSDTLCRLIISGMTRLFEDPAVREDYERWKAAREAAKA